MEEDFKAIVEQATGQQVQAFLSNSYLDANVSVEIFLLSGALEIMQAFEVEVDEPAADNHEASISFGSAIP
jgi:hypothetical protein